MLSVINIPESRRILLSVWNGVYNENPEEELSAPLQQEVERLIQAGIHIRKEVELQRRKKMWEFVGE